jgi:hypothetical protein
LTFCSFQKIQETQINNLGSSPYARIHLEVLEKWQKIPKRDRAKRNIELIPDSSWSI